MNTYETTATVEEQGQVRVAGVPFAPGTEVEITIKPIQNGDRRWRRTAGHSSQPCIWRKTRNRSGHCVVKNSMTAKFFVDTRAAAKQMGCQTLYCEDLNPGQVHAGVTVVHPFTA